MKPTFEITESGNKLELAIKGELTAQYNRTLKTELENCLSKGKSLHISLKDISAIDVSAIQLIYGIRTINTHLQKETHVIPPSSEAIWDLIKKAGLHITLNN